MIAFPMRLLRIERSRWRFDLTKILVGKTVSRTLPAAAAVAQSSARSVKSVLRAISLFGGAGLAMEYAIRSERPSAIRSVCAIAAI